MSTDRPADVDYVAVPQRWVIGLDRSVVELAPSDTEVVAPGLPGYYVAEARHWASVQARTERDVITWAAAALAAEERMDWSAEEARAVALAYLEGWQSNPRSTPLAKALQAAVNRMFGSLGLFQ